VEGDRLVLNESVLERRGELDAADLIILRDTNSYETRPPYPSVSLHPYPAFDITFEHPAVLKLVSLTAWFSLLDLKDGLAPYDKYQLGVKGDVLTLYHSDACGATSFEIALLRLGRPIRVKTNAQTDVTDWCNRDDRVYFVEDDVLIYVGTVREVEVRPWSEMVREKRVPLDEAKIVDLQKDLC
jgi:hypothetical protein